MKTSNLVFCALLVMGASGYLKATGEKTVQIEKEKLTKEAQELFERHFGHNSAVTQEDKARIMGEIAADPEKWLDRLSEESASSFFGMSHEEKRAQHKLMKEAEDQHKLTKEAKDRIREEFELMKSDPRLKKIQDLRQRLLALQLMTRDTLNKTNELQIQIDVKKMDKLYGNLSAKYDKLEAQMKELEALLKEKGNTPRGEDKTSD